MEGLPHAAEELRSLNSSTLSATQYVRNLSA